MQRQVEDIKFQVSSSEPMGKMLYQEYVPKAVVCVTREIGNDKNCHHLFCISALFLGLFSKFPVTLLL